MEGLNDKTCYLGGPMRGIPHYNHDAFFEAADQLASEGWIVHSPAQNDIDLGIIPPEDGITDKPLTAFPIGQDLKWIAQDDAVFMLPGYEKSEGCSLEIEVARRLGKPVYEYGSRRQIVFPNTGEPFALPPETTATYDAIEQYRSTTLPQESAARKNIPLTSGVLDYFPAALAAVAEVSKHGNDKHNPGQPLHWARGKSMDHADCVSRHLLERGDIDPEDNLRHSAKLAWRALALLQQELEDAGAPLSRGSKEAS